MRNPAQFPHNRCFSPHNLPPKSRTIFIFFPHPVRRPVIIIIIICYCCPVTACTSNAAAWLLGCAARIQPSLYSRPALWCCYCSKPSSSSGKSHDKVFFCVCASPVHLSYWMLIPSTLFDFFCFNNNNNHPFIQIKKKKVLQEQNKVARSGKKLLRIV